MPTRPLPTRRRLMGTASALALTLCLAPTLAHAADEFPSRTIKLVVPFPAGQGADAAARTLANELETTLGQAVVVDNKPGGNNVIGAKAVTGAPADGYTLFFGTNSPMAANAAFFRSLGYDPVQDFTPVAGLGRAAWVVVVSGNSPIRSFKALLASSQSSKGEVSYGVGATGYRLAAILLTHASGLKANIVPYKGTPQAITDVVGQQVTVTMADYGTLRPLIEGGRLRPLLVFDKRRIDGLPDTPSLADLKLDVPVLASWTGLFAPAGTPASVIARLAEATEKALQAPGYQAFIAKTGAQSQFSSPEELAKLQRQEIQHYHQAMKVGRVEPQ